MPKFPVSSPAANSLRPSVFSTLTAQFKLLPTPPIPLQLGDTYREPCEAARLDRAVHKLPKSKAYAYSNPWGLEELREAVAQRCVAEGFSGVAAENVQVTAGGSQAINVALSTWLQPGDEVLVCAPYWPLIKGMITSLGAVAVEVPFYPGIRNQVPVAQLLQPYLTDKTTALYVCTPNNPCGTVLSAGQVSEVAAFAVKHDLWTIADEAYHHYIYDDTPHPWLANEPGMLERTASIFTTSKSYALAGLRTGFLVGHTSWLDVARRVSTHQIYSVPIICQLAALGAVTEGAKWIAETKQQYAHVAQIVRNTLQADFGNADGGGYVFPDFTKELNGKPMIVWIQELLREGVCISPGDAFGKDFENFARICFTSVPEDQVVLAIERLNRSLDRIRAGRPL
jgi:N-succinyldiaminopimelate aminotransferase